LDDFAGKKPRFYALAAVGWLATRHSAKRGAESAAFICRACLFGLSCPMRRCVLRSHAWGRCQDSVGLPAAGQVRAVVTVDRILRFYGKWLT
jgi:hypothetical protein